MPAIILGLLLGLGLPASAACSTNPEKPDTVILNRLDTTQNRMVRVNRVLIIGNRVTRDRIISRELTLKSGDSISVGRLPQLLVRDKNKIYNLRLFNTVVIHVLELRADQIDILVEVSERWYIFPSPIFELSDRNFNEWWQNYHHDLNRVNYGLRLYLYNFRGRNETLRLAAQFGFTRKYELSYQIPYIDKKQKRGLVFNFDYGEPKNIAYFTLNHKLVYLESPTTVKRTFGGGITYSYRKSFYETHAVSIGYRSSKIADTVAILNPNYYKYGATKQQFIGLSYSFNSDHRDVILYPLKGYQYTGFLSYSGLTNSTVNLFEANITQARHWPLTRRFYLSNFTSAYFSTPTSQPYSLYSALGYRKQIVRGYEVYVIEGPMFFLNKTTFKKRIFYKAYRWEDMPLEQFRHVPLAIYIKTYADFGYVQNYPRYEQLDINKTLSNRLLGGAGGGVDIVTMYDLVFRLEYTFTAQGTHGFFFNMKKEF
jgi:outer membrane protein assembly factor BamA